VINGAAYDLATHGLTAAKIARYHKQAGIGWIGSATWESTLEWGFVILGAGYTLSKARQAAREWRLILKNNSDVRVSPIRKDIYGLCGGSLFADIHGRSLLVRELFVEEIRNGDALVGEAITRLTDEHGPLVRAIDEADPDMMWDGPSKRQKKKSV